jgi:membrane protease YdiL (CAAX protease family)
VHTLVPRIDLSAVAVSAVPYWTIHHQTPLPECLGAFRAGLVLGWLALQTRSI